MNDDNNTPINDRHADSRPDRPQTHEERVHRQYLDNKRRYGFMNFQYMLWVLSRRSQLSPEATQHPVSPESPEATQHPVSPESPEATQHPVSPESPEATQHLVSPESAASDLIADGVDALLAWGDYIREIGLAAQVIQCQDYTPGPGRVALAFLQEAVAGNRSAIERVVHKLRPTDPEYLNEIADWVLEYGTDITGVAFDPDDPESEDFQRWRFESEAACAAEATSEAVERVPVTGSLWEIQFSLPTITFAGLRINVLKFRYKLGSRSHVVITFADLTLLACFAANQGAPVSMEEAFIRISPYQKGKEPARLNRPHEVRDALYNLRSLLRVLYRLKRNEDPIPKVARRVSAWFLDMRLLTSSLERADRAEK